MNGTATPRRRKNRTTITIKKCPAELLRRAFAVAGI
jgi:hypothetical protein